MRTNTIRLMAVAALAIAVLTVGEAVAQTALSTQQNKTNSRMVYHEGRVLTGNQHVYAIYYGCWTNDCGLAGDTATPEILTHFVVNLGGTPYTQINSTYPDGSGQAPSGNLIFGGIGIDTSYSHGVELTKADALGIISDQVNSFRLPQDGNGIYVVFASADISATELGFCVPGASPFHATGLVNGSPVVFAFVGNANRCPTLAGPQYFASGGIRLPTPNGNFAADAMVANLAHVLNGTLTDPEGTAWYDRYGFENADKCAGTFGQTYVTAGGARANFPRDGRDYLIEQNWVNDRKGRCAMSLFP